MMLALSQAEIMRVMDLPMALVSLAIGVGFIALRKQQSKARQQRVEKGELSVNEAKRNDKIFSWAGYGVTAGGLFLLAMWASGN